MIPNCIAKSRDRHVYVGSELEKCADFGEMAFRRPVEKGYIVNWESERRIWEHEFFETNSGLHVKYSVVDDYKPRVLTVQTV